MDENENVNEGVVNGEVVNGEAVEVKETEINGIRISEDVVAQIAGKAASEVTGVAGMSGGLASGISEMLGKRNFSKGVKVQVGEKETVIDLYIIVEYGARIPDIAFEIQNKVKTVVENMTGLKVVDINIHVQGLNLPKQEKKEATLPPENTNTENNN